MSARAVGIQAFSRFGFLLLWALVLWGALQLASAVADSFSEGSTAFARLVPDSGADVWRWLAALSVLLAVGTALLGGAFVASKRASRGDLRE